MRPAHFLLSKNTIMEKEDSQPKGSLDYSNWTQHYAVLSKEAREDPMSCLMYLCTLQSLYDVRQELHELMFTSVSSSEEYESGTIRDLIFFFQTLNELFELAYRVRQLVEENKLTYQYSTT
jgi:hypothetical protein